MMKNAGTYYTEERIKNARINIDKYAWAKEKCNQVTEEADVYVKKGFQYMWHLIPSQLIFRSYGVNQTHGCLNCGHNIDVYGNYPYKFNVLEDPWKLVCPSCGMKFPANDFGAYYESALDKTGRFNPKLGDNSLLVNTLYPDKPKDYALDDGYGYLCDGKHYTFIAYYTHWALWEEVIKAIVSLSLSFIYTGAKKYGDLLIVMLDRVAELYPELTEEGHDRSKGFLASDGFRGGSKIRGSIWETGIANCLIKAVDAAFSVKISEDAMKFISEKTNGERKSEEEIRRNMLTGIVEESVKAVHQRRIYGNSGSHQTVLMLAALIINDEEKGREWIDFLFQAGGYRKTCITGGNMSATFINDVDSDGFGSESSPGYNYIWVFTYIECAELLQMYPYTLPDNYNLINNPKFVKMYSAMQKLVMSDIFTAGIGDYLATGNPSFVPLTADMLRAYKLLKTNELAKVIYKANGSSCEKLPLDIFDENPEKYRESIEHVISSEGELKCTDVNLTSYGFASLKHRYGVENPEVSIGVYYGKNSSVASHAHFDTLNLLIYAFNINISPDLGYPEFCDNIDMHKRYWNNNVISHNTVMVDDSFMNRNIVGKPFLYNANGDIKVFGVEGDNPYPQCEKYKRISGIAACPEGDNSYIFDFFRVKGGKKHQYSFHPAESTALDTQGVNFVCQTDANGNYIGTLAGTDVEFGTVNFENGYQWLKNIRRDEKPSAGVCFDWTIKDTWHTSKAADVHLKAYFIGDHEQVILANGIPPRNKPGNPKELDYVLLENHNDSIFASIFVPYSQKCDIVDVEHVKAVSDIGYTKDICALKITLKNGYIDYIVACDDDNTYCVDGMFSFAGKFAAVRYHNGVKYNTFTSDSAVDEVKQNGYTGKIVEFTHELRPDNILKVEFNESFNIDSIVNEYIYIESENRHMSFKIIGAHMDDKYVVLDIGDVSPVTGYLNADFEFKYSIALGDRVYIPISTMK